MAGWWEAAVQQRKPSLVLCDDLEGWDEGTEEGHSVQSLSRVQLFATPWTAARQASLPITNSQSLLKLIPLSQ